MSDIIMSIGTVFFFIVFFMLFFMFCLFLISFFIKETKYSKFTPFISVIIPVYNEEKNICDCLDSLFSSDYPKNNMEVLVVDDGSNDKTLKLLKKYDVVVLKQSHKGKVDALNFGIRRSKGEVIITIDADTIVEKNFITEIVRPFSDLKIGATSGAVMVKNHNSLLGTFQHTEYLMNNLARLNFSRVFNTGIWFFGALAAYRKKALLDVGGFKKDTMAEDWDIVLEIKKKGYSIINVPKAIGHTVVPNSIKSLFAQRKRWWIGGMQALTKNKTLLFDKNPSLLYLFVNHFWWAIYAIFSLPLIIYQVNYWMPQQAGEIALYLFRWFSMLGPLYVIYKIPVWGVNFYNFFGVLSGIICTTLSASAMVIYRDRFSVKNAFALFFYFPYTVLLNLFVTFSVFLSFGLKTKHFVK